MTDPNDDLGPRLDRLAPPVDVEAALAGVRVAGRRRQTRQRQLVGATMAVVVVLLLSGVALARQSADDADVVASDPDRVAVADDDDVVSGDRSPGTTTQPGTTEPIAADDAMADPSVPTTRPTTSTTSNTPDGERGDGGSDDGVPYERLPLDNDLVVPETVPPSAEGLAITISPEQSMVPIGGRVRFWVDITNRGSMTVLLSNSSCGPFSIEVQGPNGPSAGTSPAVWVPTSESLASFAAQNHVALRPFPTRSNWGSARSACPMDLTMRPFAPGDSITLQYVVDVPVVPGAPAQSTRVDIEATARFGSVDVAGMGAIASTVGRAAVALDMDPRASTSPAMFLAAVELDPVVVGWLAGYGMSSSYQTTLSYANGGFELWLDDSVHSLRVRGDSSTGAITDIRSLASRLAPGDDPDATAEFKDPGEQILFRA